MPLLGFAAYLGLMWRWTGNPFEGFEAQKHWGAHAIRHLWALPGLAAALVTPDSWHAFSGSLLDRVIFVLVLYTLPVIWWLGKDMLLWTLVLGILPAMSGMFTSYTRFACCAFPFFIALAVFTERRGRCWINWSLAAIFALLHVVLLWQFVNFRWAG